MVAKKVNITSEGLKKLEDEINYLKGHMRMEVAERIKEAISFGDISENAEYDDAKNEQANMEKRISQLEQILFNATVIDDEDITTDVVSLGSRVLLKDIEFKEDIEYYIVGSAESDPLNNKISDESPVGKELLGKKVGDKIQVNSLEGALKFKILKISK
ncbi:MAG: transcription elongation factor GreA [Bacillota bacterium]